MRLKSLQIAISWATGGAGGSGRVVADLVDELPRHGVEVVGAVAAPADAGERSGGRIRSFAGGKAGTRARLQGARQVVKEMIAREQPDVIASHFALYTAPVLDELRKRAFVVHFHGPWAAESLQEGSRKVVASAKGTLERLVYRRATRVIVLSEAFAEVARRDYGIAAEKIRIVPGAVDIRKFAVGESRAEARRALGWPEGGRVFVAVRRLVSRMGLDRLIAAMVPVVAAYPDTVLYLAGKGRLLGELEAQVATLGLSEHVRFMGFVTEEQLPLIYRAADLNVVPTLALEGFGLVVVEGLAAGTPAMVTPVGGLPEIMTPLAKGLIFRSTSVEDLAAGLLGVASGAIALPDAETCRAFARDRFSTERMAKETAAVYREAVDTFRKTHQAS